jgi:hypothetical protein
MFVNMAGWEQPIGHQICMRNELLKTKYEAAVKKANNYILIYPETRVQRVK